MCLRKQLSSTIKIIPIRWYKYLRNKGTVIPGGGRSKIIMNVILKKNIIRLKLKHEHLAAEILQEKHVTIKIKSENLFKV